MLRFISTLLVLLAVILTARNLLIKKNTPINYKYGNYLSCHGYPFDLKFKFRSAVYLVKDALPNDEEKLRMLIYGAAYYQNLFTFTNATEFQPGTKLKWTELTNIEPKIKTIKKEDMSYPFEAQLEEMDDLSGFPPISKDYIRNLIKIKTIKKGTPGLKITYEYEGDILTCLTENNVNELKNISFYHPKDPYLAYFMVPKTERILLKNESRKAEAVVNPCLNPQGITPLGFQPLGLWYFWRPFAKVSNSFDCSKYYIKEQTITEIKPDIYENIPKSVSDLNFSKFQFTDRPIRMSILLGASENLHFIPIDKEKLTGLIKKFLSGINEEEAVFEFRNNKDFFDNRIYSFLFFLRSLNEHFQIKNIQSDIQDYSFEILIQGQLKFSRKDIEIRIALAPNHQDSKGKKQFDQFFAASFLNSDIFTYLGHVNGGRIFKKVLDEQKNEIVKNQMSQLQYQIFAIFSCSSGHFFNYKDFPKPNSPHFQRDVLMSASSFRDFGFPPILALIAQIDGHFYNQTSIPFFNWSTFSKSDNFFVLYNDKPEKNDSTETHGK